MKRFLQNFWGGVFIVAMIFSLGNLIYHLFRNFLSAENHYEIAVLFILGGLFILVALWGFWFFGCMARAYFEPFKKKES